MPEATGCDKDTANRPPGTRQAHEGGRAALAESEREYRELADLLPQTVFEVDLQERLTFANRYGLETFGYTQEDLSRGLIAGDMFIPEERQRLRDDAREQLRGRDATGHEYLAQRKDGSSFPVMVYTSPILREGKRAGLRGIAVDITDQKRLQERLQVYQRELRSLGAELALAEEHERRRIAADLHDQIGQALTVCKTKLEALETTAVSLETAESLRDVYETIGQTINHVRSLIVDLSPPVLHDLGFVPAVRWLARRTREQHGVQVEVVDDARPKPLDEDVRVLLFRSVSELLTNAVRHAQASSAIVRLSREDEHVHVVVVDDGVGFEPQDIDPYGVRPAGFGLFSIRERLDFLGGNFQVRSEPGRGTQVTLMAPISRDTEGIA